MTEYSEKAEAEGRVPNSRNHHWLPQFYLKQWGSVVTIFEPGNPHLYGASVKKTFVRRDFNNSYTLGDLHEKILGEKIEGPLSLNLRSLHQTLYHYADDRPKRIRKIHSRQRRYIFQQLSYVSCLPALLTAKSPYVRARLLVASKDKDSILINELRLFEKLNHYYLGLNWDVLLATQATKPFITCESPVVRLPDGHLLFALSPYIAVRGHQNITPYAGGRVISGQVNDVAIFNTHLLSAANIVIAHDTDFHYMPDNTGMPIKSDAVSMGGLLWPNRDWTK